MQRNLVLLVIGIILGGYAYYSQEYQTIQSERASQLPVFEAGELVSFKTKNIEITLQEGNYWVPALSVPADPFTCQYVLNLLDKLRVEKNLETSELEKVGIESFFPVDDVLEFKFKNDVLKLKIGNKLNYGRSFYGAIFSNGHWKYYILKDHSALQGMYSEKEYQVSNEQYLKYVGLTHLDENFFLPQSHAFFLQNAKSLEVRSNIAKPYTIDLAQMQIHPKVFASVKVDPKKISAYLTDLAKIKTEQVMAVDKLLTKQVFEEGKDFEKLKGELIFHYEEGVKVVLKYFEDGQQVKVFNSLWPFTQTYSKDKFAMIFPHHQDYYQKKPFENLHQESIQADEDYQISGNFITYLKEKADWLTKVDKIDAQFLSKRIMQLESEGKKFELFQLNSDLVLVDLKENIKYHYYKGLLELEKLRQER